jgi:two-component system invasion response regulator UvrY
MHAQPIYAKNMLRAGAKAYITKNSPRDEIFTAITEVTSGNKYFCNEIKNNLSEEPLYKTEGKPHVGLLSKREMQIVNFIREGFSSKRIANNICISPKTVEVHRHNILKKLKLKNSSALVNFIYTNAAFLL